MNTFGWLVKREYWENRGGFFWTPVWIGGVMLLVTLLAIVWAEVASSNVHINGAIPWSDIAAKLSAGDYARAGTGLDVAYFALQAILCVVMFFVLFFYLLGALYDDRRDRSVLFWKSLPVSDTATVLSKVAAAVLLAPLIAFVVATIAYVALLIIMCIWAVLHGINPLPAIGASSTFGLFWRMLLAVPVDVMGALPTAGWLLFWSAFVRSKPFLWAILVPVIAFIANSWIGLMSLPSFSREFLFEEVFARLLFGIMPGAWLREDGFNVRGKSELFEGGNMVDAFDPGLVYGLLATPGIWIGAMVGVALLAAAIWLRRSRIETSS